MCAIKSEWPQFDRDEIDAWVEEFGPGYFIRDEERKALDCTLMVDFVFHTIFQFEDAGRTDQVFRKLSRLTT